VILDWKKIASEIYSDLSSQINKFSNKPVLWAVLVWENNSPSMRYIRQKKRECKKIGMWFELYQFRQDISEEELIAEIKKLNNNPEISGYIVQLPLPQHIDALRIIRNIDPKKDVDGFHPENQGKIMIWDRSGFTPCTPAGVMKIFEYYDIDLSGKKLSIIGRSNIVWKPLSQLCINSGASVSILNSRTPSISEYTLSSDIVVCAAGQAHILTSDMISDWTIVIDVWFSVINDIVYGDADYDAIIQKWNPITPVPGWVGPMTVAILLSNTLKAHTLSHEAE